MTLYRATHGQSTGAGFGQLTRAKTAGYLCQLTDVIGVEIDDEVGGLDKLLADIDYMNISVDYLYICYERKENKVIAVIHTDTEIAAILARKGWPIVSDR